LSAPWFRGAGGRLLIEVHVQPGASRTEVVGLHGERLKIRLAAGVKRVAVRGAKYGPETLLGGG
jgi:uncharacterized protein YggU (UPF0235/DUF167 family)